MAYKTSYDFERPWKEVMEELAGDDLHEEFYKSANPLVAYLHNRRIGIVRELIQAYKVRSILEVGSGDGYILKAIEDLNVSLTGIEISETRIERARALVPSAEIIQGDAREMPFESKSFDLVVCSEVLEHVPDPELAIEEIRRVLRPGGFAIITVPNEVNWQIGRAMLLRFPIRIPDHVNRFTVSSMSQLFGLSPETVHFLPPLTRWLCLTMVFVFQIPSVSGKPR
jgi:ubiquinone/menaquinone biosynthesis C-methylase UbiE